MQKLKITNGILLMVALAFTASANAQSIDVRVAGNVTPAACGVNMTNNGIFDYGTIPASSLNVTSPTVLGHQASYSVIISCDEPVPLALRSVDNRADTVVPGIMKATGLKNGDDAYNFGLGAANGKNIGGYSLKFYHPKIMVGEDEKVVDATLLASLDGGATWSLHDDEAIKGRLITWAVDGINNPQATQRVFFSLSPNAVIVPSQDLQIHDEVKLDGAMTMELVYL